MTRVLSGWAAAVATMCAAVGSASAAGPEILFHADVGGNFAQPSCGGDRAAPPDFADLLGAIARERARVAAAGEPPPIVLLGGNTIGPGLFARGLLERDAEAGGKLLADLLARGGYEALALGHGDLSLPRPSIEAMVRAVTARGIPVLAANLTCDAARAALCAGTRDQIVVTRAGHRITVTATVSPLVLGGLPRSLREGLTLGPPLAAIKRVAARARSEGSERVLVLAEGPRGSAGLDELLQLQRDLAAVPGVDLLLAGGRGDGAAPPLRVLRRDGSPPIVGSTEDATGLAVVQLAPVGAPDQAQVSVLGAAAGSSDAAARALLDPSIVDYCARYGQALGHGALHGPLTRDAFLSYVLAIMRQQAGAEIALVNRDFVKPGPFPLAGRFRRAELLEAMPYHATLGLARLTGAEVATLLAPALGHPRLAALGVERSGDAITVNGRAVDKARSYQVATISFLAEGGDGIFTPNAFAVRPLPSGPDLRDVVEGFLAHETADQDGDADIDPATDFGRPASARALLVGLTDLGVDFSDTAITRQPDYTVPQLVRSEQRSIKGELTGLLQLRDPLHEADGRLHVLYGYARTKAPDMPAVSAETADLISLSGIYNFRGLRDLSLRAPRIAVPDPYVRLQLESEITPPDVTVRTYRHAEATGTVGGIFTLTPKFRVRGGPGLRKQLLAEGFDGRTRFLVEAGASLDPVAIATFGALAARLEGLVDYVYVDPTNTREHQLQVSAKLSFPLLPVLFLTTGLDAFAIQREGRGWGASYDTTVGLRVHFDAAHQSL